MWQSRAVLVGLAICVLMAPSGAQAYVGPGAGLSMIGSLIAVVGALVLAILGLVLFPLRLVMKRRRTMAAAGNDGPAAGPGDRR